MLFKGSKINMRYDSEAPNEQCDGVIERKKIINNDDALIILHLYISGRALLLKRMVALLKPVNKPATLNIRERQIY